MIIHGDQFDAFTVDISNPENPGISIECPPGTGQYQAPVAAVLVDRQTIALVMPPCSVDIPEVVNFALRNKYSMDNAEGIPEALRAGPDQDAYVFENLYTYTPIPPIEKPINTILCRSIGSTASVGITSTTSGSSVTPSTSP